MTSVTVVTVPGRAGELGMGMQNTVEAALRTDVKPAIRQNGQDLPWWQRSKFGLVASEQDPLAFLLAEAMDDLSEATFAAIDSITVTSELVAPAHRRVHYRRCPHRVSVEHSGDQQGTSVVLVLSPEGLDLFADINKAAVSARSLSLRRSSCFKRLISH